MPAAVDSYGRAAPVRKKAKAVKVKRKPAPPRNADTGDAARSRPATRTPRAPTPAERQRSSAKVRQQTTRDQGRKPALHAPQIHAPKPEGPFTKKPVQGIRKAQEGAISSLSALHGQDPKGYERKLAKQGLAERATAGPRGQTIEHFKGRTIGEMLTDRPTVTAKKHRIVVAGPRGQTRPRVVHQASFGGLTKASIGNAPRDFGDIVTGMPTSLVRAAAHPVQTAKETAKQYEDIATHPEKELTERPVSTALAVSGAARAPGLAAGRIARFRAGRAARAAGEPSPTNARTDATLPGTRAKEPRKGSRGAYTRRQQRQEDEHTTATMSAREIERQVDEHYDLATREAQRARDLAARRAKEQNLSEEETAARVQAAGEGSKRGSKSKFARQFGAHKRPSVGKREITEAEAARAEAETARREALAAKDAAKQTVAERKAERGTPSPALTQLEEQRRATLAQLAEEHLAHLQAQVSHERVKGGARVSAAKRKTSPALAGLHAQLKKAEKADAIVGGNGPREPVGPKPEGAQPTPEPRNVSAEVRDARRVVAEADRHVNRNQVNSPEVREARRQVAEADKHVNHITAKGNERVAYHRAAEAEAERAVASIEKQIQREEELASHLEGESKGRFKSGKMTSALGRRIATQRAKLGELRDVLTDAQRVLEDARGQTRATHETEIGHAKTAADEARATLTHKEAEARAALKANAAEARAALKLKEAEERTVKGSSLAELRSQIAAENRRISGVAPEQAGRLLSSIDSLDEAGARKAATRQTARDLDDQIRAERASMRINQRAAVQAAEAERAARMDELRDRRTEHVGAKTQHIATKNQATTAPLTGARKKGRIFEHRYDAQKTADRLNEEAHTIAISNSPLRSPVRFGYTPEGVRPQLSRGAETPLEFVAVEVPGGKWAVVPQIAHERHRVHTTVGTAKATGAMLMRDTRRGFTRATLPFSLKWLGGQAGEGGLRSGAMGAGPADWLRNKRVVARMNEISPGAGDEYLMNLPGTHFDVTGEARQAVGQDTLAERYKGRGVEQPMAALTAAGQTLPGRAAKHGLAKWNGVVLGKINNAIERNVISAMSGHIIKRDMMGDRIFGLTAQAIDDAARGLMDTPAQVAAARATMDGYGKYSNFSPELRSAIMHWTPFLPWYINTLRFLKNTVRDHPIKTSLAVAANEATEEWRDAHGLSYYNSGGGEQVPDWQMGGYPLFGDSISRVGQFTPFGAFADPTGALGGIGLPQALGTIQAFTGNDWTGNPLRDNSTGMPFNKKQKAIKGTVSAAEAMAPGLSQALRWSGLGPRYIDRKDPSQIPPWRTRLSRELPLWPLGDGGGGGGGGGGADPGFDPAEPVDVEPVDVPFYDGG